MLIPILAMAIRLFWVLIEYPYLRRYTVRPSKDWDKHSATLWDAANLFETLGIVLGFAGIGRIQTWTSVMLIDSHAIKRNRNKRYRAEAS